MPDLFGLDVKGLVADALAGQLVPGTLVETVVGARTGDVTAGRAQTAVNHSFEGVLDDYETDEVDGTTVQAGDRRVLVIAGSLVSPVVPQPNWNVTIEGQTYRVTRVLRDPAAATWELNARSA